MSTEVMRAFRQGQLAHSNNQTPEPNRTVPVLKPNSEPTQATQQPRTALRRPPARPPAEPELVRPRIELDPMLTEKQAADYLGRKPRALNKWRQRGIGPRFVRYPDGVIRYRLSVLEAFRDEYIVNW